MLAEGWGGAAVFHGGAGKLDGITDQLQVRVQGVRHVDLHLPGLYLRLGEHLGHGSIEDLPTAFQCVSVCLGFISGLICFIFVGSEARCRA